MHTPGLAYFLLAVVVAIGLVCGWIGFRRTRFDAFAVEASDDADALPPLSSDADGPVLALSSSSPHTTQER
jgi:inositol transporter-like SP family MFS transporter